MVCSGVLPDADGRKAAMAQATIATVRIPTATRKGERSERREREREKGGKGRGRASRQYRGSTIIAFTNLNDKTPHHDNPRHAHLPSAEWRPVIGLTSKMSFSF